MAATHAVENQSAPLADFDAYGADAGLRDALRFHLPAADEAPRQALGRLAGSAAMQQHARLANVHPPVLHTHDRQGRRIDAVEFHASYHALMAAACEAGLHGTPWSQGPGAHVERAAAFIVFTGLEPSVLCPVSMSYAVLPALRANSAIAASWEPGLVARAYDERSLPFHAKRGLTMGMGMTEKQGGSDLRANTTTATFAEDTPWGRRYRLAGHKWFFSAPMCDAHLVLAQAPAGLTCFFLPRLLPGFMQEGARNGVQVQRLKDKLGNHANASSEVEFDGASAWLVGEEGRGVAQILEMGTLTRLDCALGSAGLMRQATALALHHCAQRQAFGRRLDAQPAMAAVLADLALESEAATALALRLARAVDRQSDPFEALLRRMLTPVAKFWVCKRGAALGQEAMECLGGNGYVEEGGQGTMARIYREMPLNSIWEGAGNIMALDLLRALKKRGGGAARSEVVDALAAELDTSRGRHAALDAFAARLLARLDDAADAAPDETQARRLAADTALALQASLLQRHAPAFVADTFCAARLAADAAPVFGLLPAGAPLAALVERARPVPLETSA
jgi:putative acyl-CoA dehydrogenase